MQSWHSQVNSKTITNLIWFIHWVCVKKGQWLYTPFNIEYLVNLFSNSMTWVNIFATKTGAWSAISQSKLPFGTGWSQNRGFPKDIFGQNNQHVGYVPNWLDFTEWTNGFRSSKWQIRWLHEFPGRNFSWQLRHADFGQNQSLQMINRALANPKRWQRYIVITFFFVAGVYLHVFLMFLRGCYIYIYIIVHTCCLPILWGPAHHPSVVASKPAGGSWIPWWCLGRRSKTTSILQVRASGA